LAALATVPQACTKRLVLTITTGRSGTGFLARALGAWPTVRALHEPRPRFSSSFRAVQAAPHLAREFWTLEKLASIERGARPVHVETSHLACKGFLESLVELGARPDLVHLRRGPRAVARSLWSLRTVPGRTLRGVRYYLSPADRNFLPVAAERAARWNDYQLCYWYCLEADARAAHYRASFAPLGVRVHEVALEAILAPEPLIELGRALELGPLGPLGRVRLAYVLGRRWNEKTGEKRPEVLPEAELDGWEQEIREACGLA
jgi:hypothetical protein